MPSEESRIVRGHIAENTDRMAALEHRVLNAVQSMRNQLVEYVEPRDIDLPRLRATLADLSDVVEEWQSLDRLNIKLKERLG